MKEEIKEALERNVELTEEEYSKVFEKAEDCANGNIGKARQYANKPVSEKTKHLRIQSNFYGSSINFLSAIYDELTRMNDMLAIALGFTNPGEKDENKK